MSRVVEITPASQLRMESCGRPRETVVTAAADLDAALHGGFPTGALSELCGAPGSGRTQLTLQIAANVQLPRVLGGLAAHCVYIDTRGALHPDRYLEVIGGLRGRLEGLATSQGAVYQHLKEFLKTACFSTDHFLEGTHHYSARTPAQLVALVASLPGLIHGHNVRLIIVNSLDAEAFPQGTRSAILTSVMRALRELASSHNIAVVVVTTLRQYGASFVPPCEPWASSLQCRVLLKGSGMEPRVATTQQNTSAPFRIHRGGIASTTIRS